MKTAPICQPIINTGSRKAQVKKLSGAFWNFVGPINISNSSAPVGCFPTTGRINAVAFDPSNAAIWYAGSSDGGVWKTTDSGKTWKPIADGWPLLLVSSIAVDKSGKNVYVGTGDCPAQGTLSMGVMKSGDGGKTWSNVSDPSFQTSRIARVAVHPDSPDVVLVADFDGLLWRSPDAGKTWTSVITSQKQWVSIDFGAKDGTGKRNCYAVARNGQNVYVSEDGGKTWTANKSPIGSKTSNGRPQVAASPKNAGTVYLYSPDLQKIWRNTKSGAGSWTNITGKYSDGAEASYCYCMACSYDKTSKKDVLDVGMYSVYQSIGGNGKWKKVEGDAPGHADMHALAVCPTNYNLVLIGNDGGVYRLQASFTPSPTVTVVSTNKTLVVPQVYGAAYFFGISIPVIAGMQDTGTALPAAETNQWNFAQPLGGDGGTCAVNLFNTQFGMTNFFLNSQMQLQYSIDGWTTSKTIANSKHLMASDPNRPPNPPMVIDPYQWDRLDIATSYLYRWTCKSPAMYGGSWENRLGGQLLEGTKNTVQGMTFRVAPSDARFLHSVIKWAAGVMEDLAHVDAAADQVIAGGVEVVHREGTSSCRARPDRRDSPAEDDRRL